METEYRELERRKRQQEQGAGRRTAARGRKRARSTLGVREKRRLAQLTVCMLLFLAVFVGKGVFPEKIERLRGRILETIEMDTDFQAAFSSFGRAVSGGEPITEALGGLWTELLGGQAVLVSLPVTGGESALLRAEKAFLNGFPRRETPAEHWLTRIPEAAEQLAVMRETAPTPTPTPEPEVPAVEYVSYTGPALPDNATMDKYNLSVLGITQTVTPALGWVSSGFGWREHPVDGGEKFHTGVDLAVNTGTDVLCFADGVVDYIGEDGSYGKYVQVDHGAGLTSLYAHCSALCVRAGQRVAAGERLAQSGETGNTTGPHLHFELKLNGVRLNPVYYIEVT